MSLKERTASPGLADDLLRDCLTLDPKGGQLIVSGTCMEPLLREGDTIQVETPGTTMRMGDVVLIRTPLGLRLHRVVFRFGETLRTKGDRGICLDPVASQRDVVAVWPSTESRAQRAWQVGLSVFRCFRGRVGRGMRAGRTHRG
jgi:hypothetical protein